MRRPRERAKEASPARLDALGPAPRVELLRAFAELLIDGEEDRVVRAVLVGMRRER